MVGLLVLNYSISKIYVVLIFNKFLDVIFFLKKIFLFVYFFLMNQNFLSNKMIKNNLDKINVQNMLIGRKRVVIFLNENVYIQ